MSHQARELSFRDEAAVIADVERLRQGCHAEGNWSLPQTCWHLKSAIDHCLKTPASLDPKPEHAKPRATLHGLLAAGKMPGGLPAPEGTTPPARVGDEAVDEFVAGLRRLQAYDGSHCDFAFFGPVTAEEFRQFVLIHSAHHLGMLRPTA